jgi:pimeloyl-ACP methyl ester carboxylesterase
MSGTTRVGRFRSDDARARFHAAYDAALAAWPAQPTERDVATTFGTTRVHVCGAAGAAPIVLLHAITVASPSWYASIGALSERHPVYAVDAITDAGRSVQDVAIGDAGDMARWLDEVLAGLELTSVHLVGLSYGGWIALNQTCRSPRRLASVTVVDPPGALGRARGTMLAGMAWNGMLAKFAKSDEAIHRMLRMLNNGSLLPQPLLDLCITGLRGFRGHAPLPRRVKDRDLHEICTPMLLILGAHSPVNAPDRVVERAHRLIPGVQTDVVPDAGHTIPMEQPARFTDRVLRFVDGVDARLVDPS